MESLHGICKNLCLIIRTIWREFCWASRSATTSWLAAFHLKLEVEAIVSQWNISLKKWLECWTLFLTTECFKQWMEAVYASPWGMFSLENIFKLIFMHYAQGCKIMFSTFLLLLGICRILYNHVMEVFNLERFYIDMISTASSEPGTQWAQIS